MATTFSTVPSAREEAVGASIDVSLGYFDAGQDATQAFAVAGTRLFEGLQAISAEWLNLVSDQLSANMDTVGALARCQTVSEALGIQDEFAHQSVERLFTRMANATKLAEGTASRSLEPVQEVATKTAERITAVTWPEYRTNKEGTMNTTDNEGTMPTRDGELETAREVIQEQLTQWAKLKPNEEVLGMASSGHALTRRELVHEVERNTPLGRLLVKNWHKLALQHIMAAQLQDF
jgi:hypothetical protein